MLPAMFLEIHAPRRIGEVSKPSVVAISTLPIVSKPPRGDWGSSATLRIRCP